MTRRGVTLIELLVVIAIIGILTIGITRAYTSSIDYDSRVRAGRSEAATVRAFEDQITSLLQHAELSSDTTVTSSFFIGSMGNGVDPNQTSMAGGNADTIIFTVAGTRISSELLNSDDDFETQNKDHGPQGGVTEVDISMTPIGTPQNTGGVYLRQQRPADGDPTQGGYESRLNADVESIQFEFFDGTLWQQTWDTRSMTTQRLPSAVRVTYRLKGETDDRIFVVNLPASDVTPLNPVTEGTTAQ